MRILIAEDDQVLADGLLRSLRAAGYATDHVSSGSEADAALADHEFDCVILDLGLPKMHGLDVLRQLKADGISLLLVEHDMDFVMGLADRVVVMEFGTKLMEGTPAQVQASPAVRAAYLGTEH